MNDADRKAKADELLAQIKGLEARIADPKETICKHCLNLSICERYRELKEIGYLKTGTEIFL